MVYEYRAYYPAEVKALPNSDLARYMSGLDRRTGVIQKRLDEIYRESTRTGTRDWTEWHALRNRGLGCMADWAAAETERKERVEKGVWDEENMYKYRGFYPEDVKAMSNSHLKDYMLDLEARTGLVQQELDEMGREFGRTGKRDFGGEGVVRRSGVGYMAEWAEAETERKGRVERGVWEVEDEDKDTEAGGETEETDENTEG